MKRDFCRVALAGAMAVLVGWAGAAFASKGTPITMVVPYPPGGPTDVLARLVTQYLSEELGRTIVIDNRAGASGIIGASAVSKAPNDGGTLLFNPSIHVILPSLMDKLPFDAIDDFSHVGVVARVPLVLAVNKALPVDSVAQLRDYIAANPGKVNYATSSPGSSSQLAAEQFKLLTGLDIQHIPYRGSAPAITDLIGGHVQMMFDSGPSIMPFVTNGDVRGLAVTSAGRTAAAPDLPTMREAGYPTFDHSNWYGIWGPKGMDAKTVSQLTDALTRVMRRPEYRERLLALGAEPVDEIQGEAFRAFSQSEMARFRKIVVDADIKLQ